MKAELAKLFQSNIIQYDYELNLSLSVEFHWIIEKKIFSLNCLSKIKITNIALFWQAYFLLLEIKIKKMHAR